MTSDSHELHLPRRVLYIQHAGCIGGSANSLLYLVLPMQAAGVDCVVALARPDAQLRSLYESAGIRTIDAPELCCWDHSTVARRSLVNPRHVIELCRTAARWRSGKQATLRLVDAVRPDLVHLNSMPLSSSASALSGAGVPYVWHVREPPPDQGWRTAVIRKLLLAAPRRLFITTYDKRQWIGDASGDVVPNCIPDRWFQHAAPERAPTPLVRFAYLGGMARTKGADVLLGALRMLHGPGSRWECVMPGSLPDRRSSRRERPLRRAARWIGVRSLAERLVDAYRLLAPAVEMQPVTTQVMNVLQTVDFVVFPATVPHFPRPAIEAAAIGLPTVGTDVGGVNDCVLHGETGLLCRAGDPAALAEALDTMIDDAAARRSMGLRARERALGIYTMTAQHRTVARLYREVLAYGRPGDAAGISSNAVVARGRA